MDDQVIDTVILNETRCDMHVCFMMTPMEERQIYCIVTVAEIMIMCTWRPQVGRILESKWTCASRRRFERMAMGDSELEKEEVHLQNLSKTVNRLV